MCDSSYLFLVVTDAAPAELALRRSDVGPGAVGQRVQVEAAVAERALAVALVEVLARLVAVSKQVNIKM